MRLFDVLKKGGFMIQNGTTGALRAHQGLTLKTFAGLLFAVLFALSLACVSPAKSYASSSVTYIAVLGADTWENSNGSKHAPHADLLSVARVDTKSGLVSILSIPRDLEYAHPINENAGANCPFYDRFTETIDSSWSNYDEALAAGAKETCKVIKSFTGINVSKYVVLDMYTYQDVVDKLGGVKVDIPFGIKDYGKYWVPEGESGKYVSINGGKAGKFTLHGYDAMIASRARVPYGSYQYRDPDAEYKWGTVLKYYKGSYADLLLKMEYSNGVPYLGLDQDATRQFLNRRTFGMLVNKGLDKSGGAVSFVWDTLIGSDLMWTNLSKSEVTNIGNALTKAKKNNKFTMYGASICTSVGGARKVIKGKEQFVIPTSDRQSQINATVKQFKAGKPMTKGFGDEVIIGATKGTKAKVGGTTYKVTSASTVTVTKAANKKTVSIPATVTINNKKFKVTAIAAKSMKGSKIRTVKIGNNVKTITAKAFANSKATTVVLGKNVAKIGKNAFKASKVKTLKVKTLKLKKANVKGSLAGSNVKTVKVSVAKAKKAATVKKYTKIFAKSNSKAKADPVVK